MIVAATDQASVLGVIPGSGLLFGLLLAAAIAGGYTAHAFRVPRVVGYLVAGAVVHVLLHWLLGIETGSEAHVKLASAAAPLGAIKDLGLGIILFSIGSVFEARHLKAAGRTLARISLGELSLTFVLVFLGTLLVGLLTLEAVPRHIVVCFAVLMGVTALATAPAATLSVLQEYDAKGPMTDAMLALTGLNNLVCVVAFYGCFLLLGAAGQLGDVAMSPKDAWLALASNTVGSVALGVLLGFAVSTVHAKLQLGETLLILVAILIVLGAGEGWLLEHRGISYGFLLTTLCMGATFANIAIDPDRLEQGLRRMSQPILVGFFAIAGYKLHLADVPHIGLMGAVYVACRATGKVLGTALGVRAGSAAGQIKPYIGLGMLCQAAVAIALADFVGAYWRHEMADRFVATVLSAVVLCELCGPLLTKWVVKHAGEVKAVTLLRREGPATAGGASVMALTWDALLRTFGRTRTVASETAKVLQVRHVMRSNVKCLHANAAFDEVLHFVEQSRFNHFPVVDEENRLVGVVHFGQLREIIYNPFLSRLMTAADLVIPDVRVVTAAMSLEEVLRAFKEGDVGSLPVVESAESRRVIGIVEQRDLLRALHLSRAQAQ